ncbi:hypothetical protein [Marinactinospora rubrisoli]|uniref:Uncharacterized protein n=1 Tax=Marinactinospora rubrisoli TaxID=2715399 RepID=A0ABW2KQC2_9ACTN
MIGEPDAHPVRLPGYHGGPFARRPGLLADPLFWPGHLASCVRDAAAEELLFGPEHLRAGHHDFHLRLWQRGDWPVFTVPLAAGHRLHVVYRTIPEDSGIDYVVHHPDWDRAELIARVDGNFMGPGLSWPELAAAADAPGDGATGSHARLLLLLPALGDDAVPADAARRVAAALAARTAVAAPERLATVLLDHQGLCGPARWSMTGGGVRINDGGYSYRNPANRFALPEDRLARVAGALAPRPESRPA